MTHPTRRAHARSRRFRPELLGLEPRLCLDATVTLRGGILTIVGTDEPDSIAVHGPADTAFQAPKGGLAVVADDQAYTFRGVKAIEVSTFGGDDDISFTGLTDTGLVEVDAGKGNDTVSMPRGSLAGDFHARLALGDGDDVVRVGEMDTGDMMMPNTIGGTLHLRVDAGAGDDDVSIICTGARATDWRVALGDGDDSFIAEDDTFGIDKAGFIAPDRIAIDAGGGDDIVGFLENSDHNDAVVNVGLGAGDNRFDWTGNTNSRALGMKVVGGAGIDTVSMESDAIDRPFDGWFALGDGPNTLRIGEEEQGGMVMGNRFSGSTSIRVTGGSDATDISLRSDAFDSDLRFVADVDGVDNGLTVMGCTFAKNTDFRYTGGKGTDALTLVSNVFVGDLRLVANLGDGENPVTIAGNQYGGGVWVLIRSARR
jgi:hypothetical protein